MNLLGLIYEMLDVDESYGPNTLVGFARKHGSLWHLVLSLLEQDGAEFGPASRDELARARTRSAHFQWLEAELSARMSLSVMKGPAIAEFYPPGMLRISNDLDLVFADEATLWRAAEWISANQPVAWTNVSVVGADHHLVVALGWTSTDPLLDRDYGVDLSTAALTGDFAAVPVRRTLPADRTVAALLALAEERFQRPFALRDVIDVVMIDAAAPSITGAAETISDYCRGPEVAELLAYTAEHVELGSLGKLLAELSPVVEREQARRASVPVAEPGDDVAEWLAAGRVAYGYPLGDTAWRGGPEADGTYRAHLERFSHGHLLRTPVGDWLLTGGTVLSQETYEAALRAAGDAPEAGR